MHSANIVQPRAAARGQGTNLAAVEPARQVSPTAPGVARPGVLARPTLSCNGTLLTALALLCTALAHVATVLQIKC